TKRLAAIPYTINSPAALERYSKVTRGIFTDRADLFIAQRWVDRLLAAREMRAAEKAASDGN
ncbi:MAG: hypothetical protein AAF517_03115, partial [Planctomycetota bacterium]